MPKINSILKQLLSDHKTFADLVNALLYQGEEVVRPEQVKTLPEESVLSILDKNGTLFHIDRFRDIIQKIAKGTHFFVFACENQTETDYTMPVRTLLYDGLTYNEQIKRIRNCHEQEKNLDRKAFLSGFDKYDRLVPVITIVLYFGRKEWDGATDLYSMLDVDEQELETLKDYLPNYHINLVKARDIPDLDLYKSRLKELFGILKYEKDADGLAAFLKENQERCRHLDEDVYMALASLLGEKKRLKELKSKVESREGYDMCKAFDDIEARGEQRGIIIGEQRGESKGISKVNKLFRLLAEENRIEDIIRATENDAYQNELFERYQL